MTKNAKLFNAKYNLVVSDASFKEVDISKMVSQDLAGKPKKNWIEILKRFFSNPTYTIAFLIFLTIIILSIIFPMLSSYKPEKKIYDFQTLPKNFYANLGSTKTPLVTKTISNINELQILKNLDGSTNAIDLKIVNPNLPLGKLVEYDSWKLLQVATKGDFLQHESIIGTDTEGRDIWTRLWYGTSKSLVLAISVAFVTTIIGMSIGSFIGLYVGTLIDIIFIKILSIYNSIPLVFWYATILFLLPASSWAMFAVFVITGWTRGLGVSRMYMWKYVNSDFMKSAETVGVSKLGRIFKHALPHYFGFVAYVLVSAIPATILGEAAIAFIGLSPDPFAASLGNSFNEARGVILSIIDRTMYLLLPTIIIFSIAMSLHFVAMGVNDALEPKYQKR